MQLLEVGMTSVPVPELEGPIVPIGDGVYIHYAQYGCSRIGAFAFESQRYNEDGLRDWLKSKSIPLMEDEDRVALEEGKQLFAPTFDGTLEVLGDAELKAANILEFEQDSMLAFKAKPITEGKHKGFTFTAELLGDLDFIGTRVVEHHDFGTPFKTKGIIRGQNAFAGSTEVIGLIFDNDTAEKIRSGHFHSTSSHFILEADDEKIVTEVLEIVELTLTDKPADPDAIITGFAEVPISIPMEDGKTLDVSAILSIEESDSPPPALEAKEDTFMEETKKETPPVETPTEPVSVPMETENTVSLEEHNELRTKCEALEKEVLTYHEEEEKREAMARAREAKLAVRGWVDSKRITNAQLPLVGELLTLMDTDSVMLGLFEKIIELNQVAPLGGAAAESAGMQSSENKQQFDLSAFDNDQLGWMKSRLVREAGGSGRPGNSTQENKIGGGQ